MSTPTDNSPSGLDTGDRPPTHWLCNLHGAKGALNDGSLTAHQDAEHGGRDITVMMGWYSPLGSAPQAPCCAQVAKTGVCYCQEDDGG